MCADSSTARCAEGDATVVGSGSVPDGLGDAFVAPTVLGNVRAASEVAQHEVFGPVLVSVPFSGEDAAVELANGTPYGLNADSVHA